MQFLVLTLCFLLSFLGNRSGHTLDLNMMELSGTQPSHNDGMDDLESFKACLEDIRITMSQEDPSLDVVLGGIASSKQPIEKGNIFQVFRSILKDKHKALRVLQAERERANFKEREAHQPQPIDEFKLTEADRLQIKNEGMTAWVFPSPEEKRGRPSFKSHDGFKQQMLGKLGGKSTCSVQQAGGT